MTAERSKAECRRRTVGTGSGLDRTIDGHSFTHHHHSAANPHSLSSDRISAVLEDRAGSHQRPLGSVEQALAQYDQAIALNPSDSHILVMSTNVLLYVGRADEAIDRIEQAKGIDPFHPDFFHWQMGWALWEKNDCGAALAAMRKMARIPSGAQRMLAGIHACLGNKREAKEALAVFLQNTPGESISKERREWDKIWTAPGSLDRWITQMRFAGLPE